MALNTASHPIRCQSTGEDVAIAALTVATQALVADVLSKLTSIQSLSLASGASTPTAGKVSAKDRWKHLRLTLFGLPYFSLAAKKQCVVCG